MYRYESGHSDEELFLERFKVVGVTPKGRWICVWGKKKFVNITAHKQYACLSEKDALHSFISRKKRQLRILRGQMDRAEAGLQVAEFIMKNEVKKEKLSLFFNPVVKLVGYNPNPTKAFYER